MFEIFKKLSARERNLMVIALIVIFMYGIYALAFEPSMAKRDEVENDLARLKQQEVQLNREIENFNQLKADYQSYRFEELLIKLPDEGKVPEVILWLQELFQDFQLSRPNIGFSREEDQEQYLQINLSFTGPYYNVYQLINNVESNKRLTTIDRVNLSRGASNILTASISLRVYGQDFTDISEEIYDFNRIDLFRLGF